MAGREASGVPKVGLTAPLFRGLPCHAASARKYGEAVHAARTLGAPGGKATPALAPGMDAPRTATPARALPHLLTFVPLSTSLVDFT